MCIIKKVFNYEETKGPVIKYKDEIWVKAKTVANILRYKNTKKSILDHVDPEDKRILSELGPKSKGNETLTLEKNEKTTIYINESGLYSLILRSKLESAQIFKRWVTKEVLPSIRKTGIYSYDDMNHKYNDSLTFKGELQRENKLISYERAFKMLENDMYIDGIGQAVLELLSFKVESGNHQRGISLLQKFSDIFGNMRLVLLKMTSHLTSHNFQILKIEIFSKLCKI